MTHMTEIYNSKHINLVKNNSDVEFGFKKAGFAGF